MILSFRIAFIAKSSPVSLFSARKTFPKEPYPIIYLNLKSSSLASWAPSLEYNVEDHPLELISDSSCSMSNFILSFVILDFAYQIHFESSYFVLREGATFTSSSLSDSDILSSSTYFTDNLKEESGIRLLPFSTSFSEVVNLFSSFYLTPKMLRFFFKLEIYAMFMQSINSSFLS